MRTGFVSFVLVLGVLGSAATALAQAPERIAPRVMLSQAQEDAVTLGLSREPAQAAPGYFGHVGSKPPASLDPKPLPAEVAAKVPDLARYLYVKLPDRILLVDPDTRLVAEVVGEPATTGTGPSRSLPASPGTPQR